MAAALSAARQLPHRSDFVGWIEVPGRGEYRLALGALKRLALEHGMRPSRQKVLTPAIERRSSAFCAAFLRGLFDADGSVQGQQVKGVSVRLAQSQQAIHWRPCSECCCGWGSPAPSTRSAVMAGHSRLPDGKGGRRLYPTRAQHKLVIAGDNLAAFAERIGFADGDKSARLTAALAGYRRRLQSRAFCRDRARRFGSRRSPRSSMLRSPASTPLTPMACGRTTAASSHCRLMAPACWARSTWRAWSSPVHRRGRLDLDRLRRLVPVACG